MPFDRYRAVMRVPHVGRLLSTSLVARMPNGMSSLAILLLVTRHNGYGRAGVVTGVYVASAGVSNLVLSRGADRWGARRVLLPTAIAYAVLMAALAAAPADAYLRELLLGAAAGAATAPVVSVVRGLWPRLLDQPTAQVVYGLEATAQELLFISGPALVALVAGLAGAPAAVVLTSMLGLARTVAFVASPALAQPAAPGSRVRHRLMRRTTLPIYVTVGVAITIAFNMMDVGVVAFVSGQHASAAAGVVLAVWGLGSLVGGLVFGAGKKGVGDAAVVRSTMGSAVAVLVTALAPGPVGLPVLLFAGGATIAPGLARLYSRVGAVAPEGASTEAFGWIAVGLLAGSSTGAALGGWTVDALGPRADFALAAVAPAVVALAIGAWLRGRGPAPADTDPLPS